TLTWARFWRSTSCWTWTSTAFLPHPLLWCERVVSRTRCPTAWARPWCRRILLCLERVVARACLPWFWRGLGPWLWRSRFCGRLRRCRLGGCRLGGCRLCLWFWSRRFRSWFWGLGLGFTGLWLRLRRGRLGLFRVLRFRDRRLCRFRFWSGRLSRLRLGSRFWLLRRCHIFKVGRQARHHRRFNS